MKTKSFLLIFVAVILSCLFISCLFINCGSNSDNNSCTRENNEDVQTKKSTDGSTNTSSDCLNLSIVIDLSDRLTRENVNPSQMYNDTAIINYFIDYFVSYSKDQDVNKCKNNFQILFYPSPSESNINSLSRDLCIDLSKIPNKEKRDALLNMKSMIDANLDVIYSRTLEAKKWEGCDLWDFFSNKQVDKLCIKPNYRNVVAILTDGYLYHINHKIKEDNAYSYVLPQTLQADGSLIARRNDLANVEVIMLEVNPYSPSQRDKLVNVLTQWFIDMGLDINNLSINETDVENRTETIIDSFLTK